MASTNTHSASDTILNMLQILEQILESKLQENEKLRVTLAQQQQQCEQQKRQIQKMHTQIQSLEKSDIIAAADVINLEWEEAETLSRPSSKSYANDDSVSQDDWCQLVG